MLTHFPKAIPQIPVSNIKNAVDYYVNMLGFHLDWCNDEDRIAGISQGDCRMFLANSQGNITVWLNLNSKNEVDELYDGWRKTGAKMVTEPEDKPWNLREFIVADLDGNQLRVFYDFTWELQQANIVGLKKL